MAEAPTRITKDFLVDIGGWELLKEAQAMVAAGRVREARYRPPILSAIVEVDGRDLVTRLKIGRGAADVENLCTCRQAKLYGTICVHVVAAGWAFLQQQENASAAYAKGQQRQGRATPVKKTTPQPATWKRVLVGSAEAESVKTEPLLLRLILPLTFPATLGEKATRLTLEACPDADSDTSVPWDAIPKTLAHTYAVDEDDEALLHLLERVHGVGDPPPAMTNFPAKGYALLLKTLDGHPRVWIGKKHRVRVHAQAPKPTLRLASQPDGTLELRLGDRPETEGEIIALPGSEIRYAWTPAEGDHPAVLQRQFTLTGPYAALVEGPVTIPADAAGNFLARELPALSRLVELDDTDLDGRFDFDSPKPEIIARIDGSLAGVTVRLQARYPAGAEFDLPPAQLEAEAEAPPWQPDSEHATRFWRRDAAAERAALAQVVARGFQPGRKNAEFFFLNQERAVGDFLANVLPDWRRRWRVEAGKRFQQLLPRLDYVQPDVSLARDEFSSSGEDWLSLDITPTLARTGETAGLDAAEIQRWIQTGQSHQRTEGDRILLVPTAGWRELQEVLADAEVEQRPGAMRLSGRQVPGLLETLEAQGWRPSGRGDWDKAGNMEDPLPALPDTLGPLLRPYQAEGVRWLAGLAHRRFGGVLADEMGLGKTLQTLALLCWLRAEAKSGAPALVVCPTSLVENWADEAARFTPRLKVLKLHGPGRKADFAAMEAHDLVITSYALLRRDLPDYPVERFGAVVLDEAQHIKNRASQNAQAAKALRAEHRFVLTGTPLENALEDLWSIFDFALPGYLGSARDFKERYAAPVARGDEAVQQRLRHRLRPFLLRRTKEEVVRDLPPKLEQVSLVDLSPEQTEVYQSLLTAGRRAVFDGSGRAGRGRSKIAVLTTLLRLRQCVCDLRLLDGDRARDWREPSAKLDLAMERLHEAIDGGHRVLVFSQFVKLLGLLRTRLEEADIAYAYLDGSTRHRADVVKRFQGDDTQSAFLISLKAGGTGLNLTGADTVLHLDPWWNPAVEDQATARAHRIGQDKPVTSYKLIARGTVEEKILRLQERKRELFTASVTNEELFVESLSWDEIESLLE
ncbi:MAG: DEAD/DEAH box helicase [Verrucomicrobiota bacterium]